MPMAMEAGQRCCWSEMINGSASLLRVRLDQAISWWPPSGQSLIYQETWLHPKRIYLKRRHRLDQVKWGITP